jgi:hypothetical protein
LVDTHIIQHVQEVYSLISTHYYYIITDLHSTVADHIDHSSLLKLAVNIVNECQAGNVSHTLNITGKCKTVEYPSTDLDVASIKYVLPTPHHLYFHTKPVADYEGILLITQPKVRVADISVSINLI